MHDAKSLVWLFSGQGSHYYRMGERLHRDNERFRAHLTALDRVAEAEGGESITALLYHPARSIGLPFARTAHTHPALFMVQYALAATVRDAGVEPDCLFGASLGEYVAASVAGVVDAADMLAGVIDQARTFEALCPPGGMLAILKEPDFFDRHPDLFRACERVSVNMANHFVVSGPEPALASAAATLQRWGVAHQLLPVSRAFHSAQLEPAADAVRARFAGRRSASLDLPWMSCTTADWRTGFDGEDVWQIARRPLRTLDAITRLCDTVPDATFIDFGPSPTLSGFIQHNRPEIPKEAFVRILNPIRADSDDLGTVLRLRRGLRPPRVPVRKDPMMKAFLFPGQGSQRKGMGTGLFDRFPEHVRQADAILGYSIRRLCQETPNQQLTQTQFTQPALFIVNVLTYLAKREDEGVEPDYLAGHSLGEYCALFAAGAFDFETGVRLVQQRGALMSQSRAGGMAAVIGLTVDQVKTILVDNRLDDLRLANLNTPTQLVLSGGKEAITAAATLFGRIKGARCIPLNVSAAFHSHLMAETRQAFADFLAPFTFRALRIPVIANLTARPYEPERTKANLIDQITGSVLWTDTIRYLWGRHTEIAFEEVGPGTVLTDLTAKIKKESTPLPPEDSKPPSTPSSPVSPPSAPTPAVGTDLSIETLGSACFRQTYGVRYAYAAGAMYQGIASRALVVRMGQAGMIGFLGTGGLEPEVVQADLDHIRTTLTPDQAYGVNLLHDIHDPQREEDGVDLYLRAGVRHVEASGYMQTLSPALVRWRALGLRREPGDGRIVADHTVIAKVSRPEVAAAFLDPAPERLLVRLREAGRITADQAALAAAYPMADLLCIEADSAGHTDQGVAHVLMPAMIALRDERMKQYQPTVPPVGIGAAGGIGTPEAAAAAFILGADFIVTGSINQCTVESGANAAVKDMLQTINVQDTDYAPAGDMFEMGAKVQVMKKGVFFPARGKRLYDLYQRHTGLDEIDPETRKQIEGRYFRRSFEDVYQEVCRHYRQRRPEEIEQAERNPRHKMALVFRWYFGMTTRAALDGDPERKVDYQVHTGPALGAFNQWVKGTTLEDWRNRHVDEIGIKLLTDTLALLQRRFAQLGMRR